MPALSPARTRVDARRVAVLADLRQTFAAKPTEDMTKLFAAVLKDAAPEASRRRSSPSPRSRPSQASSRSTSVTRSRASSASNG
jgi:hypothetical protein